VKKGPGVIASPPRAAYQLTLALAAVMTAQALTGLLLQGEYRDVEPIRSTWFGNDWITLVVAVPLLLSGLVRAKCGSGRALLLWLGMIGYALYNYAFYLFGAALSSFFLLYVIAFAGAVVTLAAALRTLDVVSIARRFAPGTPVRLIGGSLAFIEAGLGTAWVVMWALHIFSARPTPVDPDAFKVVAALDLSLMVPALTAGGILLWRREPWGYVISAIASTQGALYLLVLSVNSIVAVRRGLAEPPGELPVWGTLALLTTTIAIVILTNVQRTRVTDS
jgi:hypothetical protein